MFIMFQSWSSTPCLRYALESGFHMHSSREFFNNNENEIQPICINLMIFIPALCDGCCSCGIPSDHEVQYFKVYHMELIAKLLGQAVTLCIYR